MIMARMNFNPLTKMKQYLLHRAAVLGQVNFDENINCSSVLLVEWQDGNKARRIIGAKAAVDIRVYADLDYVWGF